MQKKIKKEVEGIECNACLTNIFKEINQIDGVAASIDYRKKTVTLDIAKSRDNVRVINKVKAIANKHGHHFIVKEKRLENKTIKTFFVENLDCANCAAKIAQKVGSLEEITNAICDFLAKKLVIEIEDDSKLDEIIRQTESAVKTVEPDVKLVDWDEKQESEEKHKESLLKDYLCFGIGSVFFVLGLVLYLSPWWELTFFVVSYLFVGSEVLIKALKNIIRGRIFDENLLMTIATIGAFLIGDFGEGVAVMIFYQVGELLQGIAVERSRKSISKLMDIRPEYAYLQTPEGIKKVKPTEVNVGDKIIVKPGDRIPLDGTVLEGNSFVDTAALTGESVLREVQTGAGVYSGFINKNGLLTIEVTKNYGNSAVSVILDLVENASSKKTPTENFITKVARFYTPAVVFLALMIAFLPLIFVKGATLGEWGHRALVFLVISCPCALVISIPLGFFGGIGGASRRGILVKGSNYLDALNNIDTVVFDKTGTLTHGVFKVTEVNPQDGFSPEEVVRWAGFAEKYSNHPIAQSILNYYQQPLDEGKIDYFEEISGMGTKIMIDGKEVLAGNAKLMTSNNIPILIRDSLGTVVYIALNKQSIGSIVISDEIKSDAKKAIGDLKALGVKHTVMLTGDSHRIGEAVGQQLGIDAVYSELLPQDKVTKFELLDSANRSNGNILFVGDGLNDAPVLARADVGIAMGGLGRSDAAIEAADIVIITDEPSKIATAIKIAKRTRKIVWENIVFSLAVKFFFLLFGALGMVSMWAAVFADVGVSIIAIINSMRVMKTKRI